MSKNFVSGCRQISMTICLTLVLFCLAPVSLLHAAEPWKSGSGRVVITPEQPMWMSGYAGRAKPAEGTLHDLWAKAALIQSPTGQQAVLISLDLVGIDSKLTAEIAGLLKEKHGLERSQIVINTSHTHCGPVTNGTLSTMYFLNEQQQKLVDDYTTALPSKVVAAVDQAYKTLEAVELSYAIGESDFAVNRRENPEPQVPALREAGTLKGPVDHAVPVLIAKKQDGTVQTVLFGYACHATTLNFLEWNGDWPGFAQIGLEKLYPGANALFVAGCGADQNPLPRRTVELAEKYGNAIVTAVRDIKPEQWTAVSGEIKTDYQEIEIPFSQLPTREQIEADLSSTNRYTASRARGLIKQLDETGKLTSSYDYPVQVWKIGNVPMVFLSGEVVVDYSLRIKGDFDLPLLWVAGYSNDIMAYVPSRRVLLEGGYEGATSMVYYGHPSSWAPQIESMIIEQVGKSLAKVK